ncbi:MAG: Gfo/Idh/MocA family oxidoreductase [Phycisphaerae bacterium]|nr:Gfo/Idh/MocA family oxidoreductase [Phycisphaerae bacterium]
MAYTRTQGEGRVGYLALGHDERAFNNLAFQSQVVRQLRWATGETEVFERSISCAIVGYGGAFNMGKLHADSISGCDGMHVSAVCDADESRLEIAEDDFPGVKTYNHMDKLLADDEVELCVLVTPHNTHAPLAIQCSKAGKHVVCEKPFCLTIREATDMINAARKARTVCTVFHNRRRDADYLTIKGLVDGGAIGEVYQIEANAGSYGYPGDWWRSNKVISGGAFYDWGAHFIDWILNLAPRKIQSVYGFFPPKRVWHHVTNEDHCWTAICFEGGLLATFEQSSIASIPKAKWRILGTKGGITMGENDTIKLVQMQDDGRRIESTVPYVQGDWHGYYRALADHLILGEPLEVTPESARRVIAVLSLAETSSAKGKPLPVPYENA